MQRRLEIALIYLSERRVAYSSIAFHLLKNYFVENGVRIATYFYEQGNVIAETPSPSPIRARIIITSLPYELLYIDLVRVLDTIGMPVWRKNRSSDHPIVLAGGPSVTANPAPLLPILDAALIGEAEPVLDRIIEASQASTRSESLDYLSTTPGVLVPGLKDRVRRVYERDLDNAWYPINQKTPRDVEPIWGKSFMLETTRGCSRMCRFCMEGSIFRPKRDRSFNRLKVLLDSGIEASEVSKVSFYSLAFFDNPHAERILEYAVGRGLDVSVPSIRAETLTYERAKLIAEGGQRTVTIAPETGSCRIGKAVNKCIGVEGTLHAIDNALEGGLNNVKLYIMTGFPGESDADFSETVELVEKVALEVAKRGGTLKVTVNPFIPKPVTPLQWAPAPEPRKVIERIRVLRKKTSMRGGKLSFYEPKWLVPQVVLSRGDEKIAELIVEWARRGGRLGQFRSTARNLRIDLNVYLKGKPVEWTPPWHDVVEHPYASLKSLRQEYKLFLYTISGKL